MAVTAKRATATEGLLAGQVVQGGPAGDLDRALAPVWARVLPA